MWDDLLLAVGEFVLDILPIAPEDEDFFMADVMEIEESTRFPGWAHYRVRLRALTRQPEGWYVWGGVSDPEQEHRASFYGTDMPETFRIALVLADGTVTVTNEITRTRSMQGFTVHADEGTITTVPTAVGLLLQFLCTCSITLLIEGVLLRLFRFSFRENWKVFLAVNLATQILMTLTFGRELIDGNNYVAYLLVFLVELAIFVIEAVAYAYLLHGQTRTHRVVYALWANAASFVCGIWLAVPVFNAIMEMM